MSFSSKWENIVPQWVFQLNSALATAETWDLKGHTANIMIIMEF